MDQHCDNLNLLSAAAYQITAGILIIDQDFTIKSWNRFMEVHSGKQASEVLEKNLFEAFPDLPRPWLEKKIKNIFLIKTPAFTSWEQRPYLFQFSNPRLTSSSERYMLQNCSFFPIIAQDHTVEYVCLTLFDATDIAMYQRQLQQTAMVLEAQQQEQKRLIKKLEEAQNQLLQSEKMAAIGQLAAGVAHEINNPIGYVASNIGMLESYLKDLLFLIDHYEQCEQDLGGDSEYKANLLKAKEKVDLCFLREDTVDLVNESKEGISRVKKIVQDLKDFSHVDNSEWQDADLHHGLDSTLNVVNNEIKYKAEVIKEYGEIPLVNCLSSQINQVFMNLLVNAAHAIQERGTITIRTGTEGDGVWVEIEDSGCGIEADKLNRIFEPFYTTKPVGKGTGLGLSLSYGIITKHKGKMDVKSTVGKGTVFRVWLPIERQSQEGKGEAVA